MRSSSRRSSASRPRESRRECRPSMRSNRPECMQMAFRWAARRGAIARSTACKCRAGIAGRQVAEQVTDPGEKAPAAIEGLHRVGERRRRRLAGDRIDLGQLLAHRHLEGRLEVLGPDFAKGGKAVRMGPFLEQGIDGTWHGMILPGIVPSWICVSNATWGVSRARTRRDLVRQQACPREVDRRPLVRLGSPLVEGGDGRRPVRSAPRRPQRVVGVGCGRAGVGLVASESTAARPRQSPSAP